jgi:Cu/Ag efflux pump CusA
VSLPPGYFVSWGGQFELQQEAGKRLMLVVPVTLLIILILLFMNFGSLKNTLLILFNIPLALVGGIAGLSLSLLRSASSLCSASPWAMAWCWLAASTSCCLMALMACRWTKP